MFRENRALIVAFLSSILFHSAFFLIPHEKQTKKTLAFKADVFFEEKATDIRGGTKDSNQKKLGLEKIVGGRQAEKDSQKTGGNTEEKEKQVLETLNVTPFFTKEYELREEQPILLPQVKKEHFNQNGIPRVALGESVEVKKLGEPSGEKQNESGPHFAPETMVKDFPLVKHLNETSGPSIKKLVTPKYPETARRLGKEGVVLLRVLIDKDGRANNVEVIKSAGYGFDEEAKKAIMESIFIPLLENGIPRSCLVDIPVRFVLKNDDKLR